MTDKALRLVEAVLSTCQTEEETEEDMLVLKAVNALKMEMQNGWDACYAYGGVYVIPVTGATAQLQLRLTQCESDFFTMSNFGA